MNGVEFNKTRIMNEIEQIESEWILMVIYKAILRAKNGL